VKAEFKTHAGLRLLVTDWICQVQRIGSPPREHPVPEIIFVGSLLSSQASPSPVLYPVKKGRLLIPYGGMSNGEPNRLGLPCPPDVDQFPAVLTRIDSVRDVLASPPSQAKMRFIVVDDSVPKIDLITLKVKQPQSQVLVVHAPEAAGQADHRKVRAADLVQAGQGEELQQNPVFMARVHLRNLELPLVRDLLVEFEMSSEEIQFVRTFLQLMIRNDRGQADLHAVQKELLHLDELYRLAGVLASGDRDAFDRELEVVTPGLARDLLPLVARRRARAPGREDQIYFWECEFRLTQAAEKTA
jgi:hypothetical protein